jgi:ribosomal protein S18 acetylase RimI-like enzyme
MHEDFDFTEDTASLAQVAAHLRACDGQFIPPLSERVNIDAYATKITTHAKRFEVWSDGQLIGIAAIYCNQAQAYLTNLSVLKAWHQRGLGAALLARGVHHVRGLNLALIALEVASHNMAALQLYKKCGFDRIREQEGMTHMALPLATKE